MLRRCAALACVLTLSTSAHALTGDAPLVEGARYEVMILGSAGTFCTGTALARDLVLTAAHCVQPGGDYKLVHFDAAGKPYLQDLSKVALHPQFSMKTFIANRATPDVALLKVAQPLPDNVTPAILGERRERVAVGESFVVRGFGIAIRGSNKSGGKLRRADLVATGKPGNIQLRLFDPATRGETPGVGACTGDSGGPVYEERDGKLAIYGVVSWSTGPKAGDGCGGLTGVTPLELYLNWIAETAGKLGSPLL